MKLYHTLLLPSLPYKLLMRQHRKCCRLRGKAWNKNPSYIFENSPGKLWAYHMIVCYCLIKIKPKVKLDQKWFDIEYRGKKIDPWDYTKINLFDFNPFYVEHNKEYLKQCIDFIKKNKVKICNINLKDNYNLIYKFLKGD